VFSFLHDVTSRALTSSRMSAYEHQSQPRDNIGCFRTPNHATGLELLSESTHLALDELEMRVVFIMMSTLKLASVYLHELTRCYKTTSSAHSLRDKSLFIHQLFVLHNLFIFLTTLSYIHYNMPRMVAPQPAGEGFQVVLSKPFTGKILPHT
jgi:hypothetical protein